MMTTEQRLKDLEKAVADHNNLVLSASKMLQPAAAALRPQIPAAADQVRRLRVAAFQALQQGDVHGLIRALGVHHAFDACMTLGVGSLQALTSCTRNQFSLWARPQNLGWGAADAVPARVDNNIVTNVDVVLRSIGVRWREPHEKPRVRLPEPVLSRAFNPSFDPKARFRIEDFSSYAHPSVVYGPDGRSGKNTIVHALAERGIYSWDDLGFSGAGAPPPDAPRRTLSDLKRTGLSDGQLALIQWEMRRRGVRFHKELPPVAVEMDWIDVDKLDRGADPIDERDVLSFEDRIKVRDKVGNVVGVIEAKNELDDRVGAEADDARNYGDQGGSLGVNEHYIEEDEGELVQDEDDAKPAAAPTAPPSR